MQLSRYSLIALTIGFIGSAAPCFAGNTGVPNLSQTGQGSIDNLPALQGQVFDAKPAHIPNQGGAASFNPQYQYPSNSNTDPTGQGTIDNLPALQGQVFDAKPARIPQQGGAASFPAEYQYPSNSNA